MVCPIIGTIYKDFPSKSEKPPKGGISDLLGIFFYISTFLLIKPPKITVNIIKIALFFISWFIFPLLL